MTSSSSSYLIYHKNYSNDDNGWFAGYSGLLIKNATLRSPLRTAVTVLKSDSTTPAQKMDVFDVLFYFWMVLSPNHAAPAADKPSVMAMFRRVKDVWQAVPASVYLLEQGDLTFQSLEADLEDEDDEQEHQKVLRAFIDGFALPNDDGLDASSVIIEITNPIFD